MPSLDEIKQKRHKKFIKKPYRMWDLSGEKNTINLYFDKKPNSPFLFQNASLSLKKQKTITSNNEPDNRETTERQQPDNRETTTRQQRDNNQTTERQQPDNNSDNNSDNRETTIRQQTITIKIMSDEKLEESIKTLSGLQEKLFYLVLEYCNLNNDTQTGKLKTAKIAALIGCNYQCVKIIIERITKKSLITRLKGKGSVAGYIQFEVLKEIKIIGNRLTLQKQDIDIEFKKFIFQIRQQIRQQLDNRSDNFNNSSSSYLLNTTTTSNTQRSTEPQLPPEWQNLDIEPLNKIGFTTTHLSQIAEQNKLQSQAAQDSIYAFAFDLQENDKAKNIKGDPINYFMGILRNGRVYTFPSNYESPQDKAMRLYTEQIRAIDQKRKLLEKEAIDLSFNDWFVQLTNDQKREYLPKILRLSVADDKLDKDKMLKALARSHFETNIWPDKKREIAERVINPEQGVQNQILANIEQEVSNVENN